MSTFARPFRVTQPDGTVLHGVQFPRGFAVVDNPENNFWHIATGPEHLKDELGPDIVIEWADAARHGYTPHGHPCCGRARIGDRPATVYRCGGVRRCGKCQWEASLIHDASQAGQENGSPNATQPTSQTRRNGEEDPNAVPAQPRRHALRHPAATPRLRLGIRR